MAFTTGPRTALRLRIHHLLVLLVIVLGCSPACAQILIGQTTGFSGPVAAGVKETADGALLFI